MKDNHLNKIDGLTKFFTYEAAKKEISSYIKNGGGNGKDSVFLMKLDWWDQVCKTKGNNAVNSLLAKFSFIVTKVFHKTDLFVRVGPATFFIYSYGYIDDMGIQRVLYLLKKTLQETEVFFKDIDEHQMHIGVLHVTDEDSLDKLLRNAEKSLANAIMTNQEYVIDCQQEPDQSFEHYPQAIPHYYFDTENIDTSYVMDVMNFLFGCMDLNLGIEMTLSRVCDYFHVQQIYIMEKNYEQNSYFKAHNWKSYESFVESDNFKKLPLTVGDSLKNIFDENNLFVCNQLSDLYKYNAFIALRSEIQGAKSLMLSALFDNGEYIGYICMVDYQKERIWTVQEMAIFSTISKMLNMSIVQLRAEHLNQFVTNCDSLTNAWNMHKFSLIAQEKIDADQRNKALVTLDIKNFKFINSEYGYQCGNAILIAIAQLLHSFIDKDECFARVNNDTFILLLYYHHIDYLQIRLSSLLHKIERCCISSYNDVQIISIMGVYLIGDDQTNLSEMIDYANMARKSIKDSHSSCFAFFNDQIKTKNIKEHHLAQIMKQSLKDEEFIVYYQPKINIHTNCCIGLEALIRWQRPDEIILPDDFIPLFEKNHFIVELDNYVLEKTCQQMKEWIDCGYEPIPVSVNISRVHLESPNIVYQLTHLCDQYFIPRHLIELEITETAFLENEKVAVQRATELKQAGFMLSMDDFGTGFSSLSLLKDLMVDTLKLDRTFFLKECGEREKIILMNIIQMAKQLHVNVISEGIETAQQVEFLKEIYCDIAQGYYYSRPYPMSVLQDKLWKPFKGGES